MVRSIVIPHDQTRSPRLRHLADLSDFQAAVDGYLEPLEVPSLDVTIYMCEAARRDRRPPNTRATALWWYYSAQPTQCPLILGDIILTGNGEGLAAEGSDIPEPVVQQLLGPCRYVVQGTPHGNDCWYNTYARFDNLFDAAIWCMLFSATMRPGPQFRVLRQITDSELADGDLHGGERSW